MKVFVTGVNSFIGSRFIELARENGHAVHGVDIAVPSDPQFHAVDIRSATIGDVIPDNTDVLVHLAAISRDPDCRSDPKNAFDVNVQGTLNLIDAARTRQVGQFIFASTEWVYGDVDNETKQQETDTIDVTKLDSEYALSKIVGEQVLRLAYGQGFCPVTVLRFGIVYGPRPANWSAVEALLQKVCSGERVEVGSRRTARRFIHVDDVCHGILACLGRQTFEVFNLSGNDLVSLIDVIETSCDITGNDPEVIEKSPDVVSIRNPINDKIKKSTDWRPEITLKQGLESLLPIYESGNR